MAKEPHHEDYISLELAPSDATYVFDNADWPVPTLIVGGYRIREIIRNRIRVWNPVQPTWPWYRVGKVVRLKGLEIRGTISMPPTIPEVPDDYSHVSFCLVRNLRRANYSTITPVVKTDVFTLPESLGITNDDTRDRYQVIRRWDYSLTQNTDHESVHIHEYVDLSMYEVGFSGLTAGNLTPLYGELMLVALGDSIVPTEVALGGFSIRLCYYPQEY